MMALINGESSSVARPGQDGSSTQGASLHHLADLATAEGDNRSENQQSNSAAEDNKESKKDEKAKASAEKTWDPVDLMRAGYLHVLGNHLTKA